MFCLIIVTGLKKPWMLKNWTEHAYKSKNFWNLNSEGIEYYVRDASELATKITDEKEKIISNNFLLRER